MPRPTAISPLMFITTVCQVAREALEHLGVLKDKAVEAQPELAVSLSPSRGVLVLGPDFKHWTRLQAPDLKKKGQVTQTKKTGLPDRASREPCVKVQSPGRQTTSLKYGFGMTIPSIS